MAVRLESTIKRYTGLSSDDKPRLGQNSDGVEVSAADLPVGSSFLESDTGNIYRWTGTQWQFGDSPEVLELREIKALLAAFAERLEAPVL